MTQFVENLVDSVEESAKQAAKQNRGRPRGRQLLAALRNKRHVCVTCHRYPDPDALGSAAALAYLLDAKLPDLPDKLAQPDGSRRPRIRMSVDGDAGVGMNAAFTRHGRFDLTPWDPARFDPAGDDPYDAVVLCDVQPSFPYSPLTPEILDYFKDGQPTAIVDHHRARGRRPGGRFVDIRTDVGATASIVFGYFMDLDVDPPPDLAATMLYAIESDLAGAAGQPSDLDNAALSTLTLRADTRRLYRMRHVSLPRHYFVSYANALADATVYETALFAHIGPITALEKPAVIADFLLRCDGVDWAVVTALAGETDEGRPKRLVVSARAGKLDLSAGEAMRKAMTDLGEGGGHRTKAGGFVALDNGTPTEIDRVRLRLRQNLLEALKLPRDARGRPLIEADCDPAAPASGPVVFVNPDA